MCVSPWNPTADWLVTQYEWAWLFKTGKERTLPLPLIRGRGPPPPLRIKPFHASGFRVALLGFLTHGHTPMYTRIHTRTDTSDSLNLLSPISPLTLFSPSLPRLFVVFHLPGLFECINQSSRGATAITHLVRIRERKREWEGEWESEHSGDRTRQQPRGRKEGEQWEGGKKMER